MEPLENGMFDTELDYELKTANKSIQCGICGEHHSPRECNILKVTNHIPDKVIPSKARLTLPDSLELRKLSDGTYSVYTRCPIEKGTQFGPFQAKKLFTLHPSIIFPLKIFTNADEDLSEYFLDTSEENDCNWLVFIGPASDFDEQNLICYQEGEQLYYSTIKTVRAGEPLKVWYSPHYATKMKKVALESSHPQEIVAQKGTLDVEVLLKKNKNVSARDSWSCKFCGKIEKQLSAFAMHLLEHYRTQLRRICTICKESFISRQRLNKHLRFAHGNNVKEPIIESIKGTEVSIVKAKYNESKDISIGGPLLLNDISPDSLDNSNLLLPQTDLIQFDLGIDNQNMLLENENLHLNMDNILNDNVKQLDHFNFELKEPETEQLICDICLKSFLKLKSLVQHIEQHTGKYSCYECNRVFSRKENYLYHSCNLFYKFKCPLCEKIFFQKKYLTRHIKATHDKQFTCDKCNRYYESKQNLAAHVCPNVPMNKREKYPCSICSRIFFYKKNLDAHCKRRHKTAATPSQQFICAICNVIFNSNKTYVKHAKLHEGQSYSCDICHKAFTRTDTLRAHKKVSHTNQMQTCEICHKQVKSKKLLKTHMEVHANNYYKCEICPVTFKHRSNLTKHTNKHKNSEGQIDSLFKNNITFYSCPKCNKNMKLKSSLLRHLRVLHPDYEGTSNLIRPRMGKLEAKKLIDKNANANQVIDQDDESVMDLKQTIENMDFNTDEVNNCSDNNDINIEIDKLLNNADNIDSFLCESSDRIVESLISIATRENQLGTDTTPYVPKEVCLSMPDLTESDQEIKLGENAYILDNGTIVEPQDSSSKVVVYILDQDKFS